MAKCPSCGKEVSKLEKKWKYSKFTVSAYLCDCGTVFRDYAEDGKHRFTLKYQKGKGFRKVKE